MLGVNGRLVMFFMFKVPGSKFKVQSSRFKVPNTEPFLLEEFASPDAQSRDRNDNLCLLN